MARVSLRDSHLRSRRRKRRLVFVAIGVVLVAALFAGLVYLSRAAFLRITSVVVLDAGAVGSSTIQAFAERKLEGMSLFLFPNNNILLYPKRAIRTGLLREFSTLKDVSVYAQDFHTVAIAPVERKPVALWCGEDMSLEGTCFLLDENGFAYAPAPEYSGDAFGRYFGVLATTTRQYLTPQEFQSLFALVQAIAQEEPDETVSGVSVDANADVTISFARGGKILFGLRDKNVFQRFLLALTADSFASSPISDFDYLDLRFGNKIYYKAKEQ